MVTVRVVARDILVIKMSNRSALVPSMEREAADLALDIDMEVP